MNKKISAPQSLSRRKLIGTGLAGFGAMSSSLIAPSALAQAANTIAAQAAANGKVLVVMELSGGNDGLNTVVPYGDDAYYRHRPQIGLAKNDLRILLNYMECL